MQSLSFPWCYEFYLFHTEPRRTTFPFLSIATIYQWLHIFAKEYIPTSTYIAKYYSCVGIFKITNSHPQLSHCHPGVDAFHLVEQNIVFTNNLLPSCPSNGQPPAQGYFVTNAHGMTSRIMPSDIVLMSSFATVLRSRTSQGLGRRRNHWLTPSVSLKVTPTEHLSFPFW
jgi:hypothetical protein